MMTPQHFTRGADVFHTQELRIALVMNGGVSLAVWIGGVTHEINRLVRKESVYGRLCDALAVRPRVDVVSGTSAGGINGGLLALAMSRNTSLDPLRQIWLDQGDILALLREPTAADPPSLLDGGYFYRAMLHGFTTIAEQPGRQLQSRRDVPIELTLTTTVLRGEVRDFPDDLGSVIRDVTHRGQMTFKRGPDLDADPFEQPDIVRKLATAARATASFPGAFEPFYLPNAKDADAIAGSEIVGRLDGHANFLLGCFVVDGGVLDNNPLESAVDAVFRQRAEREVRRILAYVVPDPGHIPDPPSQQQDNIPNLAQTVLAALVNIPRVESISDQLRAITEHNRSTSGKRDTRVIIAQTLGWQAAQTIAQQAFTGYREARASTAADHIASALAMGAARCVDAAGKPIAIGRRRREQLAGQIAAVDPVPWIPAALEYHSEGRGWDWGLFTLENVTLVLADLLRRAVRLAPVRRQISEEIWQRLRQARSATFDVMDELAKLRRIDHEHWEQRGALLCHELVEGFAPAAKTLRVLVENELRIWSSQFQRVEASGTPRPRAPETLEPPLVFATLAARVGQLLTDIAPVLRELSEAKPLQREAKRHAELKALTDFLLPQENVVVDALWQRLLVLEVVQFTFSSDRTREQYMELVQISANGPTAFGGPCRLEEKLAGVQVAHFGAFYKRSWRINDWMFGRLDGAERLMRVLLDPSRLVRLYGWEEGDARPAGEAIETVLNLVRSVALSDVRREDDRALLEQEWHTRLSAMRAELSYLEDPLQPIPGQLHECASLVTARLHLDILREEIPELADAVGDDMVDGANATAQGPKFMRRFERVLCVPQTPAGDKRTAINALTGQLPAEQLVELFREAKVGEEKIAQELGTDRFTVTVARAAAVASSAFAGKHSGLGLLRGAFAATRVPLITLDIIISGLMKSGRVTVGVYSMLMASALTILAAQIWVDAKWPALAITSAVVILVGGCIVFLRRHIGLMFSSLAILAGLWVWLVGWS